MSDFHKQLAELVFPHVTKTPEDFQRQYPPRNLPDGAKVTRFAPSPTGFVHIGSLMTSLVDKLVARQSGGVFFLRIEDTDKKREQDRSIEEIVQNLNNFDLTPDEGAVDIDPLVEVGAYAPYLQSARVEIYEAFAKDMIARGNAYPCFCTEEELSRIRTEQEAAGAMPGYYGRWAKWRDASLDEVKARLDAGERPVIRIRAPYPNEARARFTDLIRGALDLPANDQDSVLVKSNSLPTYHFAHVVDDTLMRVNTIVRGEEWLPSAPLHIQTFEFLGLPLIDFAHVAPIAKMDGNSRRKLSKRKDPEANVMYYHEAGYPRQAVTEYLLNLANSGFYDWRKANPTASAQEFPFKLGDMGVAMPLFDFVKLNDVSKDIIATYTAQQVYDYVVTWAQEFNPRLLDVLRADKDYAIRVFNVERTGSAPRKDLMNWSDVERVYSFFFDALFNPQADGGYPLPSLPADDIRAILDHVRAFDAATPKDVWLDGMRGLAEQLGFARDAKTFKKSPGEFKGHFGDAMMVVRVALTGRTNTPDLHEILSIFGKERIGRRVEMALSFTNQP